MSYGGKKTFKDVIVGGVDVSQYMMMLGPKEYLTVQGRLVVYRHAFPGGMVKTELVQLDHATGFAMFRAEVYDGAEQLLATAYGSETLKGFPGGYIEKAETIAVGRALLFAGIGVQYAEQGMEEDGAAKLADSPVTPKTQAEKPVEDNEKVAKRTAIKRAMDETSLSAETVVAMATRLFKGRSIATSADVIAALSLDEVGQLVTEMKAPISA